MHKSYLNKGLIECLCYLISELFLFVLLAFFILSLRMSLNKVEMTLVGKKRFFVGDCYTVPPSTNDGNILVRNVIVRDKTISVIGKKVRQRPNTSDLCVRTPRTCASEHFGPVRPNTSDLCVLKNRIRERLKQYTSSRNSRSELFLCVTKENDNSFRGSLLRIKQSIFISLNTSQLFMLCGSQFVNCNNKQKGIIPFNYYG